MDKKLQVILTQTHDGKPLATVRNFPGLDADMTPEQMRAMAAELETAATECEQGLTWQEEADHLFARLQQIAPRAVKLYSRPTCERDVQKLRRAMEYWERENDKTVAALNATLIKFQR